MVNWAPGLFWYCPASCWHTVIYLAAAQCSYSHLLLASEQVGIQCFVKWKRTNLNRGNHWNHCTKQQAHGFPQGQNWSLIIPCEPLQIHLDMWFLEIERYLEVWKLHSVWLYFHLLQGKNYSSLAWHQVTQSYNVSWQHPTGKETHDVQGEL